MSPHIALFGGEDGLDFYRILAKTCGTYLKSQGHIAFEIGFDQAGGCKGFIRRNRAVL